MRLESINGEEEEGASRLLEHGSEEAIGEIEGSVCADGDIAILDSEAQRYGDHV